VVEFLIEQYGSDVLRRILVDLSVGMPIEQALQRYIGPPNAVDHLFADFARQRAEALAPSLDWNRELLPEQAANSELESLLEQHPNNYWLMRELAKKRIDAGQWESARELLERLHAAYPTDTSPDSAARQLARVYRQLQQPDAEARVLTTLVECDGQAVDACQRLMELAVEQQDWPRLRDAALRLLAVNPLIPVGHEMLALAGEPLQRPEEVVAAQRALLQMDPADPAQAHFRLASSLRKLGQLSEARHEVLQALEAAPRYRAAQQLLLELVDAHAEP
jgi:tetratricopeptide (TPR) repeat protein